MRLTLGLFLRRARAMPAAMASRVSRWSSVGLVLVAGCVEDWNPVVRDAKAHDADAVVDVVVGSDTPVVTDGGDGGMDAPGDTDAAEVDVTPSDTPGMDGDVLPNADAHVPDGDAVVGDEPLADVPDVPTCPSGQTRCDAGCIDPMNDDNHCGGCGMPCIPTDKCVSGRCVHWRESCSVSSTPGCEDGMVMVPRGTFTLGNGDAVGSSAISRVIAGPILMDRYEVTVERFQAFWMSHPSPDTTPVTYPPSGDGSEANLYPRLGLTAPTRMGTTAPDDATCNWTDRDADAGTAGRAGHPMNCVNWDTAQAFCVWDARNHPTLRTTGRLPTEAEWELAARGADPMERIYPWGNTPLPDPMHPDLSVVCAGEARSGTCREVGTALDGRTPDGIFHLVGNVWEMTADIWATYTASCWTTRTGGNLVNPLCQVTDDPPRRYTTHGGGYRSVGNASVFPSTRAQPNAATGFPAGQNPTVGFRCVRSVM